MRAASTRGASRALGQIDPAQADTPHERQQLSYLVRCALNDGTRLTANVRGVEYSFTGRIGLAPRWAERALTPTEQRWVSACMLAHVNAFGKHVKIALSARGRPPVPFLRASASERAEFPIHEGGFFGNLFVRNAVAYACEGRRMLRDRVVGALRDRVCTRPVRTDARSKLAVSACGFVLTGNCDETIELALGQRYGEVIDVYLQASGR